MRAVFALFFALWCGYALAFGHGQAQGTSCNARTGLASDSTTCFSTLPLCDGSTDDATAWNAWNTWARGKSGRVTLLLPSGYNCRLVSATLCSGAHLCPFGGIPDLLVIGYGATFSGTATHFVTSGIPSPINNSPQVWGWIANANMGDTCVTLLTSNSLTPAQVAALFTSANPVIIGGMDLQGTWQGGGFGYPPNWQYFDFPQISSISSTLNCDGVTSGASVKLDRPLTHNYRSDWPLYDTGGSFGSTEGGPGIIWTVQGDWNAQVEFRGLTFTNDSNAQEVFYVRHQMFRDVTVGFSACIIASVTQNFDAINSDFSICSGSGTGMEVDKLIHDIEFFGGQVYAFQVQSSSTDKLGVVNTTINHGQGGTPKAFYGDHATLTLGVNVGPTGFGRADSFYCNTCSISSIGYNVAVESTTGWSMSGNVISVPNTANQHEWIVPGTNFCWRGPHDFMGCQQIGTVTQDATNTFVQVLNCMYCVSGGFPGFTGQKVFDHPSPIFSCPNCTGTAGTAAALLPLGQPLYNNGVQTYTGASGTNNISTPTVYGNLKSIEYNVTNGWTGSITWTPNSFNNSVILLPNGTESSLNPSPSIQANSVGDRLVTPPSTVTCVSGTCSGDTNMSPGSLFWFSNAGFGAGAQFGANAAGQCPGVNCPSLTLTIKTDQNIAVNPATQ